MTKQKLNRELEPVRICGNGEVEEVRIQVDNEHSQLWHKVTPEGLEFRCKCPRRMHIIPWSYISELILFLSLRRDELWNLLCDGQSLFPVLPGMDFKGTRLVSVIWPRDGILTFVS